MKLSRFGYCIALLVVCFQALADDVEVTSKIINNDFVVSLKNTSMINFEIKNVVVQKAGLLQKSVIAPLNIYVGKDLMVGQVADIPVLSVSAIRQHADMALAKLPLVCAGSDYVACTGRTENVLAEISSIPVSINLEHASGWKSTVTTMLDVTFARILNQPQ